jgi:hypothetical protein
MSIESQLAFVFRKRGSAVCPVLSFVSQDFPVVVLLHFKECIRLCTCKPPVLKEIFPEPGLESTLFSQKRQKIAGFQVSLADGTLAEFFPQLAGREDFTDVLQGEQSPVHGDLAEKRALAPLPDERIDISFP